MGYKRQFRVLLGLTVILALIYGLTIVFDPRQSGGRTDSYTWLDPRLRDSVDRIELRGAGGPDDSAGEGPVILLRRNGRWLVPAEGREYPARQSRIDDLLEDLSRRDTYSPRSVSPSSHGRFGLSGDAAGRITLGGGAGLPLLDLLVGSNDAGGGVYLRRAGGNEVRSGEDRFSSYVNSRRKSWYDLRLFPDDGGDRITADLVQRIVVAPPAAGNPVEGNPPEGEAGGRDAAEGDAPASPGTASPDAFPGTGPGVPLVITREQNAWRITAGDRSLGPGDIETSRVDSYIGGILAAAADDFVVPASLPEDASLSLELGDGRVVILRLGPPGGESGQRQALVLGAPGGRGTPSPSGTEPSRGYLLASWVVDRIFREPEYFRK
jgi:hypothetical protein